MNRRSMTIIEVATAVVILSIALAPLVSAMAESAKRTADPVRVSQATLLAEERMEQIVAARYQSTTGYAQVTSLKFPSQMSITGYGYFARDVLIGDVASDLTTPQSNSGIRKVTVTVSWDSASRSVSLTRIFTDF